jgi:hypothetical protein
MSHTTKVKGLSITSKRAIIDAVKMLKEMGVLVELLTNATPRMYYRKQMLEVGVCDFVVNITRSPYDVGFKLKPNGEYEILFDEYMGSIRREIGLPQQNESGWSDTERRLAHISKLTTAYSTQLVNNNFNDGGIYEMTTHDLKDGGVQLVGAVSQYA